MQNTSPILGTLMQAKKIHSIKLQFISFNRNSGFEIVKTPTFRDSFSLTLLNLIKGPDFVALQPQLYINISSIVLELGELMWWRVQRFDSQCTSN